MTTHSVSHFGSTTIRVGVLCDINEKGHANICSRWSKPFEQVGIEVEYIPIGKVDYDDVLEHIHGLLLPGGDSNIHPSMYTQDGFKLDQVVDDPNVMRDVSAIKLLKAAYDKNIPTIGICRGMQEMIVAFGGELKDLEIGEYDHAKGYKLAPPDENGRRDHEKLDTLIHPFHIQDGGILAGLFNTRSFMVNSIHKQGITKEQWQDRSNKRLRDRFIIEGLAPDDVVEAISAKNKDFFLGLQPHWELRGPLHDVVFEAFFKKIKAYAHIQQLRASVNTNRMPA